MVFEYGLGVLLQVLGTLGLCRLVQIGLKDFFKTNTHFSIAFGLAYLIESTLLGCASLIGILWITSLQIWVLAKVAVGLFVLWQHFHKILCTVRRAWPLFLIFILWLLNCCVPTSNFDCFSAHLPIPKLFLEAHGYPLRPDFQYLDALPLGAHMWFIPPLSLGLEGGCNAIAPLFSFFLIFFILQAYGKKMAGWSLLVCLSMPEFIRVSLDPMVDTPCFFYACVGCMALRSSNEALRHIGLIFWCFLFAIKPTLAPFALVGTAWFLSRHFTFNVKYPKGPTLLILMTAAFVGCFWTLKNGLIHHNIFYPYWGSEGLHPLIPQDWHPILHTSYFERIYSYFKVIFCDYRYNLSLGFWPLFCLPFIWRVHSRAQRWTLCLFILGMTLTFFLTPFKNRYAMPYFFVALPTMALFAARSPKGIKVLLGVSVAFNLAYALPYMGQPLYAALKNWNKHDYYRFKFSNYGAYEEANLCPEGKILLIGQASYWLERPHILAVISETNLDFTRMQTLQTFRDFILEHQIAFVVFDRDDTQGMASKSDPWYRGKAWCAQKALYWVDQLLLDDEVREYYHATGVQILDVRKMPSQFVPD